MRFKCSKEELVRDMRDTFRNELENGLYNSLGIDRYGSRGSNSYVNNVKEAQEYAEYNRARGIANAITTAFEYSMKSMMDNIYTDEEFEQDLNLRDKQ